MNKPKHFYSHLVDFGDLEGELGIIDVSGREKNELLDIAHIHLHETIIGTILSHLTETDKKRFLELMVDGADDAIWEYLNAKIEKIEEKITDTAKLVKAQLKEDIKKVKKN